jgi:hypothetical protein
MCGSGIAPTVAGGSFIDLDPVNVDDQVPGHATPGVTGGAYGAGHSLALSMPTSHDRSRSLYLW